MRSSDEMSPISWRISRMPTGSRPFVGSSRTSSSGSPRRAPAIPSRCFMPIEYSRNRSPARVGEADLLEHGGDPRGSRPPMAASTRRFSVPVSPGYIAGPSISAPTRGRKSAGESSGLPSTVPSPEVGATSPSSIAIVVVLPAPFGPMNPATTPRGSSKLSSSTADPIAVALGQPLDLHGRGERLVLSWLQHPRMHGPVVALVWRSGRRALTYRVESEVTHSHGQTWPRNPSACTTVRWSGRGRSGRPSRRAGPGRGRAACSSPG